jgi:hypothetical protein
MFIDSGRVFVPALVLLSVFFSSSCGSPRAAQGSLESKVRREADYILACQFTAEPGSPAYGAINDVYGKPTWVVPAENANAMLALCLASGILGDARLAERAELAADFLLRIQDADGAWADRYEYADAADRAKSPSQTAEVLIALDRLGYRDARYPSVKKGAEYLEECSLPRNKKGADDGLLCGGKGRDGRFAEWRWCHDNSYAYLAFCAASSWARKAGEEKDTVRFGNDAARVLEGLGLYVYDSASGAYCIAIDENGIEAWPGGLEGKPSWIRFAPVFLGLPVSDERKRAVCEWAHSALQQPDGSVIGYDIEGGAVRVRKYPGLSFQAAIMWSACGYDNYANDAVRWAETSGLYAASPDANGVTGSFADWVEVSPDAGLEAPFWQRFIDTSYYYIEASQKIATNHAR